MFNHRNSSLTVQCSAPGICEMRHTQLCDTCEYNCGHQEYKSYYKPKRAIDRKGNKAKWGLYNPLCKWM